MPAAVLRGARHTPSTPQGRGRGRGQVHGVVPAPFSAPGRGPVQRSMMGALGGALEGLGALVPVPQGGAAHSEAVWRAARTAADEAATRGAGGTEQLEAALSAAARVPLPAPVAPPVLPRGGSAGMRGAGDGSSGGGGHQQSTGGSAGPQPSSSSSSSTGGSVGQLASASALLDAHRRRLRAALAGAGAGNGGPGGGSGAGLLAVGSVTSGRAGGRDLARVRPAVASDLSSLLRAVRVRSVLPLPTDSKMGNGHRGTNRSSVTSGAAGRSWVSVGGVGRRGVLVGDEGAWVLARDPESKYRRGGGASAAGEGEGGGGPGEGGRLQPVRGWQLRRWSGLGVGAWGGLDLDPGVDGGEDEEDGDVTSGNGGGVASGSGSQAGGEGGEGALHGGAGAQPQLEMLLEAAADGRRAGGGASHGGAEREAREDAADAAAVGRAVGAVSAWRAGVTSGIGTRRPVGLGVQWPAALWRAARAEPGRVAAALAAAPVPLSEVERGRQLAVEQQEQQQGLGASHDGASRGAEGKGGSTSTSASTRHTEVGVARPPPDGAVSLLPFSFPRAALRDPEPDRDSESERGGGAAGSRNRGRGRGGVRAFASRRQAAPWVELVRLALEQAREQ